MHRSLLTAWFKWFGWGKQRARIKRKFLFPKEERNGREGREGGREGEREGGKVQTFATEGSTIAQRPKSGKHKKYTILGLVWLGEHLQMLNFANLDVADTHVSVSARANGRPNKPGRSIDRRGDSTGFLRTKPKRLKASSPSLGA